MKITDPDVIKSGEKDLIEAVRDDLDLDTVREILEKRMAASTLSPDGGEIIVHNNEIAFKLNFNVQLSGSLMFDRQGNYIPDSEETGEMDESFSQNLDMSDLDIEATLEQVGPNADEPDADEPDADEIVEQEDIDPTFDPIDDTLEDDELNINLPDYSLDDDETIESEDEHDQGGSDQGDDLLKLDDQLNLNDLAGDENSQQIPEDDLDDLDPDPDLDITGELDLSNEFDSLEELDPNEIDTPQELDALDALDEAQTDGLEDDDLIDDDISDILKESRDFWEQKKDS